MAKDPVLAVLRLYSFSVCHQIIFSLVPVWACTEVTLYTIICVCEGEGGRDHSEGMEDLCSSGSPCRWMHILALVQLLPIHQIKCPMRLSVTVLFYCFSAACSAIQVTDLSKCQADFYVTTPATAAAVGIMFSCCLSVRTYLRPVLMSTTSRERLEGVSSIFHNWRQ